MLISGLKGLKLLRRTQKKHIKATKRHRWARLEKIQTDCILLNLKNVSPNFFKFISISMKMSLIIGNVQNHPCLFPVIY